MSFAYLTGLVIANNNAVSNSDRSNITNRQEAWFDLNQSACFGAITASIIIGCDQPSQIYKRLKRKSSYFNLVTFDNTLTEKRSINGLGISDKRILFDCEQGKPKGWTMTKLDGDPIFPFAPRMTSIDSKQLALQDCQLKPSFF